MKKLLIYGLLSLFLLGSIAPVATVWAQNDPAYRSASDAARLRATRNLVEQLFGVWLTSKTEVENFQTKKDTVIAKTQGQLYGVSFSKVVEDRKNGLLLVTASVSREDALSALEKSGYKGGGSLEEFIQAQGEAAFSGPWKNTNPVVRSGYYERELSLATCMTFLIFNELNLTPPSDLAQWNTLVKEVDVYATTALSRDLEGRVRIDMKLKRENLSYILRRAKEEGIISSSEQRSAEESFMMLGFDKGLVASCLLKDGRLIKPSSREARFLNLNNDVACALTEQILKLPTSDIPSEAAKYAKMEFTYSDSDKQLSLELVLDKANIPFVLSYMEDSDSKQIIAKIGKGVKLAVEVYGR